MVLKKRTIKLTEISEIVRNSKERAHQVLVMKRLSARTKAHLKNHISSIIEAVSPQSNGFLTVAETCIRHYKPEGEPQSKQRTTNGEPTMKNEYFANLLEPLYQKTE